MTINKGEFTKAKRFTFFHTSHTTTFDGSETQHVKSNFTASIDGNHETIADIIIQNGPVAMRSTASIDGNIAVGGTVDGVDVAAVAANLIDANASIGKLKTNIVNANASIGSNKTRITRINSSINRANASIMAIKAWNLIRSEKYTVIYSQLTATSGTQSIPLFRASPGDTVYNLLAYLASPFGLIATPQRTLMSIGDPANATGFGLNINVATPVCWEYLDGFNQQGAYLRNEINKKLFKNYGTATFVNAVFTASNMFLASLTKGQIDIYIDVMSRA